MQSCKWDREEAVICNHHVITNISSPRLQNGPFARAEWCTWMEVGLDHDDGLDGEPHELLWSLTSRR